VRVFWRARDQHFRGVPAAGRGTIVSVPVIRNEVTIDRRREEVFDYLSDPRSELEWNPNVRVMEKLSDGPIRLGSRFRAKWTKSPVVELEITTYDRPSGWSYVNGGPISVDLTILLEVVGDATKLTSHFDATARGPMRLVFPLILRSLRKEERRNMKLIKAKLESM
jgi:uncharacterized protein YndB with AHSA1/START domain